MDNREHNLSFGKVVGRTDGSVPDFPEPSVPERLVEDHYLAFYRVLRPSSEHDGVLASASCVIGSPMKVVLGDGASADANRRSGNGGVDSAGDAGTAADTGGRDDASTTGGTSSTGSTSSTNAAPHLETARGEYLAPLTLEDSALLLGALERGWEIRVYVDQIVYSDQEHALWAEFAFFAFDPAFPALGAFVDALVGRIAHGEHPSVSLKQGEFQRVIESGGRWYLTKECPRPELKPGEATFKRRRGLADTLVGAANQNKIGCEVAAIIFWAAILALIAKLVFF